MTEFKKESFLPISRFALLARLTQLDENKWGDDYAVFLQHLATWRHLQYRSKLHRFKELYLPFSPDRDTLRVLTYTDDELKAMRDELIHELTSLLLKANYSPITEQDLEAIFAEKSAYGLQLKVDLSEFENVLLFSRGSAIETNEKRTLKSLYLRKEGYETPVFQRLFLLLKLKPETQRIQEIMSGESVDEKKARKLLKKYRDMLPDRVSSDSVYLKIFKQIPQIDLEMLFPNTQVKLKPFDKLKLGITAGGGTAGSVVGTATKLAAAVNPVTIAGVILGLAAVIFRQVTKFFTQRTKYMMVLAQKLYFHNLANNRGVLTLMVDRAEEEEIKEIFLLYHFLVNNRSQSKEQLKNDIEAFVEQQFGTKISFNINRPIAALVADELLTENGNNMLSVLPPSKAVLKIKGLWERALL